MAARNIERKGEGHEMSEITVEKEPLIDQPPPEPAKASATKEYPKWMGNAALLVLVVQNSALVLTMKHAARTRAEDGSMAVSSTMVVMIAWRRRNSGGLFKELHDEIVSKPRDTALLLIPSFLYLVQNNLLFIAVANLEAAVYQVLAQLKILTTAFFSILILKRELGLVQWMALLILTGGCIVVQLDTKSESKVQLKDEADLPTVYPVFGLICALLAQCTSGFAGVFCEKMLKQSGGGNMAIRNIQLGVPALFFGLCAVMLQDRKQVLEQGYFKGYTQWTWMTIALHSFGGLLVTVIMKLTSNIAKTFAIAISLIVSTIASVFLFGFIITVNFVWGACMVIFATFMFTKLLDPCLPCLVSPQNDAQAAGKV